MAIIELPRGPERVYPTGLVVVDVVWEAAAAEQVATQAAVELVDGTPVDPATLMRPSPTTVVLRGLGASAVIRLRAPAGQSFANGTRVAARVRIEPASGEPAEINVVAVDISGWAVVDLVAFAVMDQQVTVSAPLIGAPSGAAPGAPSPATVAAASQVPADLGSQSAVPASVLPAAQVAAPTHPAADVRVAAPVQVPASMRAEATSNFERSRYAWRRLRGAGMMRRPMAVAIDPSASMRPHLESGALQLTIDVLFGVAYEGGDGQLQLWSLGPTPAKAAPDTVLGTAEWSGVPDMGAAFPRLATGFALDGLADVGQWLTPGTTVYVLTDQAPPDPPDGTVAGLDLRLVLVGGDAGVMRRSWPADLPYASRRTRDGRILPITYVPAGFRTLDAVDPSNPDRVAEALVTSLTTDPTPMQPPPLELLS